MNDNPAIPNNNTDKLYKLRPMINQLNWNFVKLYNVSHYVSVDESMILFKDRSAIKQYNPMKPIKRSLKLWSLADMDGYLHHWEVYQVKNQVFIDDSMPKYFGLGPSIVYQLTKPLNGKHHQVFIDNYFSTAPFMEYLLHHILLVFTNKSSDIFYRIIFYLISIYYWQRTNRLRFPSLQKP